MVERGSRIARIQGDGRRIHLLLRGLRSRRAAGGLALADPQIQVRAFLQLALLGIALHDRAKLHRGARVVVPLERPHAVLVHRERFVVAGLSRRWRRRRRRVRASGRLRGGSAPAFGSGLARGFRRSRGRRPRFGGGRFRRRPGRRPRLHRRLGRPGCVWFRCRRLDVLPRRWVTFLLPGLFGHAVLFGPFALARAASGRQPGPILGSQAGLDRTK